MTSASPPRNPFRDFNSSPEVIRLTVMMYVSYLPSLETSKTCLQTAESM